MDVIHYDSHASVRLSVAGRGPRTGQQAGGPPPSQSLCRIMRRKKCVRGDGGGGRGVTGRDL